MDSEESISESIWKFSFIYASDKVYMWLYDVTYWDKYGSWEDDQEGDLKAEQEQPWTSS